MFSQKKNVVKNVDFFFSLFTVLSITVSYCWKKLMLETHEIKQMAGLQQGNLFFYVLE